MEATIQSPVRPYRITTKRCQTEITYESSAVAAIKHLDKTMIARVEVLYRTGWVELQGVV